MLKVINTSGHIHSTFKWNRTVTLNVSMWFWMKSWVVPIHANIVFSSENGIIGISSDLLHQTRKKNLEEIHWSREVTLNSSNMVLWMTFTLQNSQTGDRSIEDSSSSTVWGASNSIPIRLQICEKTGNASAKMWISRNYSQSIVQGS